MRIFRPIWFGIVLVLLAGALTGAAQAHGLLQTSGEKYFDNGHSLRGEFLAFYESFENPEELFGQPITDQFEDVKGSGQLTQYLQKARFDLVPTANGKQVQLAPLGQYTYQPGRPVVAAATSGSNCRYFPASDRRVCRAFLQFYDEHNGPILFGAPISDVEDHDGRYVQYFEKVRMEWQPEMANGERVRLGDLGKIYFDEHVKLYDLTEPQEALPEIISVPLHLQARAFVLQALAPANSEQTVYVIIQNQQLKPVARAIVKATVRLPDGSSQDIRPPETDENGLTQFSFTVPNLTVQQIVSVEIVAQSADQEARTSTWFRVWW